MFNRCASLVVTAIICLVITRPGLAQTTDGPEPYVAVVNTETAALRAYAASTYYRIGTVKRGDLVLVTGEKNKLARIAAVGPVFEGSFGYIMHVTSKASPLRVAPDGKTAVTLGTVEVLGPNMDEDGRPRDSYRSVATLKAEQTVEVLHIDSGQREVIYTVKLPEAAAGWLETRFLRPASSMEQAQWTRDLARLNGELDEATEDTPDEALADASNTIDNATDATDPVEPVVTDDTQANETVLAREEESLPPMGNTPVSLTGDEDVNTPVAMTDEPTTAQPTATQPDTTQTPSIEETTTAPETRTAQARLEELEQRFDQIAQQPTTTREVIPLRELYLQLANDHADNLAVVRVAEHRAEQLDIWAEIQQRLAELQRVRENAVITREDVKAVRVAFDDETQEYAAVGRLELSVIFDGKNLPRLYRLQDPSTGRTVAYVEPSRELDMVAMVGQMVGIIGRQSYDPGLRLNRIEARGAKILPMR